MAKSKKPVCGLEIGAQSITLTQCLPGDTVVTNVSIQPLDPEAADFWSGVDIGLRELVGGLHLGGADVVVSLPGEYSVIKRIAVDHDESSVREALAWELGQLVIGTVEEYVFDYHQAARQEDPERREFLVVGYRDVAVRRLTKLLTSHKLNPIIVDIDLLALINAHEINYRQQIAEPTLIVHGERTKSKLILTREGEFYDCEICNHDIAAEVTAAAYLDSINDGINRLLAANKELVPNRDTLSIILTGPLFSDPQLASEVLSSLGNAEMLDPFKAVTCTAGMSEDDLKTYSPQLGVAVGLALRGADEVE